ncbi:hypothetical protein GF371_02735 [Candidatus Woesearchaeota archaeon]|nr:hypothetical protein [Candidatus Woesearchaeota archaeon]
MKKGLFVHTNVKDPGKNDPGFGRLPDGRIECSAEGDAVKRYLENQKIIEELGRHYELHLCDNFWYAALRVTTSDKFDFIVTNFPPREDQDAFVKDRRQRLDRMLAWKDEGEKERIAKLFIETEGELTERLYEKSVNCLKEIFEKNPSLKIIIYTGAYPVIRDKCKEIGAYMLSRGRYRLEIEIDELKNIIESQPWPRSLNYRSI